jgi:hypothetical protein
MKTNLISVALVAALLALGHTFNISGTTHAMLLLAGTLYLFGEMNREMNRFDEGAASKVSGGKR